MLFTVKSEEKMTALKFVMSCLFIKLNITISCGDNTSMPPRHISEFSDLISGFNPFVDLEEGFVNDSRPLIDRKLIENRTTNLLSAISITESGRSDFFNEYKQSKIPNERVYNSNNKTETIIKKLIAISHSTIIPRERHFRVHDSINNEESIRKLLSGESQQAKIASERHSRIHDSIKNKESTTNKLILEESQKISLTTVNNEPHTTENIIATNKDILESEIDDLKILNYLSKCKKIGISNYRTLRNKNMEKQSNSNTKIHFQAIHDSSAYAIYAIVCTVVIVLLILYVILSLKRTPLRLTDVIYMD